MHIASSTYLILNLGYHTGFWQSTFFSGMEAIIALMVFSIGGYLLVGHLISKNKKQKYLDAMHSNYGFTPHLYQIMAKESSAIAIDTNQRMICIVDNRYNTFYLTRQDIYTTEILVDKSTYQTKSFLSVWGKYYLTKAITGNDQKAGIAALTTNTTERNKFKTLQLRVATRNAYKPNHILTFLVNGNEHHKKAMMNDIYDWVTRIETL